MRKLCAFLLFFFFFHPSWSWWGHVCARAMSATVRKKRNFVRKPSRFWTCHECFNSVISIRTAALRHGLFKAHLEEVEAEHKDLVLHTGVRWLSKGEVLTVCLDWWKKKKRSFWKSRNEHYVQNNDTFWFMDLAFFTKATYSDTEQWTIWTWNVRVKVNTLRKWLVQSMCSHVNWIHVNHTRQRNHS